MKAFAYVNAADEKEAIAAAQERAWQRPRMWIGPGILAAILGAELIFTLARTERGETAAVLVAPRQVGHSLFGAYLIGVEVEKDDPATSPVGGSFKASGEILNAGIQLSFKF